MNKVVIIKESGEKTTFEILKLILSLRKAGASEELATSIASDIESSLFEGMTTKAIYKKAFTQLKNNSRPVAARYKLKKAIMELGETGYPFEKFIAALLESEGYETKQGIVVQGHCIRHEVDVIAENDSFHYMCECKFHNKQSRHCDVKIPLYIQSRFKDVERAWIKKSGHRKKIHQGWIFTNTRFTTDATQYALCSEIQLVSWDYPIGNGLKERIDRTGVHPITCLTSLSMSEKKNLINNNIITCRDLLIQKKILSLLNFSSEKIKMILAEVKSICPK